MDLVERIETTRFLGPEFLVWFWFKTELFEGNLVRADGSPLEAWLDTQLQLQSASDKQERTTLRGTAPSASPEAKLALQRGKWPMQARVCLTLDGRDFSFVFDSASFSLGNVILPQVLLDDADEAFTERMQLLESLYDVWQELYAEFLALRVSAIWRAELVPALQRWIQGEKSLSQQAYRGLLKRSR